MVNTKCPPKYKNLGLETFGNKKKVTDEILEQCCKNDEWLKRKCDILYYQSPARIRKRFNPIIVNSSDSYGYMKNSNNEIVFSDNTHTSIQLEFNKLDKHVDLNKSDCAFTTFLDNDYTTLHKRVTVPMDRVGETYATCRNFTGADPINSFGMLDLIKINIIM